MATKNVTGTPQQQQALAKFGAIRDGLQTPEALGRALVNFLLTEGPSQGTFSKSGSEVQIPLTATMSVPGVAGADGLVASDTCSSLCITAFGHEIICMQACIHEQ